MTTSVPPGTAGGLNDFDDGLRKTAVEVIHEDGYGLNVRENRGRHEQGELVTERVEAADLLLLAVSSHRYLDEIDDS